VWALDGGVREQFQQGVTLHGPIWYTFSHRRWKIVWTIVDLLDPFNLPEPSESLETEPAGISSLRELGMKYGQNPRKIQKPEEGRRWVSLQDLSRIPLPVAFKSIVEDLTN